MTDEHMDARLRAAGEQWRAANDTPAGVDVEATVAAREPNDVQPAPRRRRHWGLYASAAVVLAALVVGGLLLFPGSTHRTPRSGTDHQATVPGALVGTVWELTGYEPSHPRRVRSIPPGPPSSDATFYISPHGQLVADDSCAVIGGHAQVGKRELTVTDQVIRYRSCTDTVGEMVFTNGGTKVLDGTASYQFDGSMLYISRAGTTMRFVTAPDGIPAPTLDVPTFVGAHWRLVREIGTSGNDVVPTSLDNPLFVDDSGRLTMSDGCVTITAQVSGQGPRVRVRPISSTTADGCVNDGVASALLNGSVDEAVNGASLTIRRAGAGELVYQWVPTDKDATDPTALDGKTWRLSSVVGEPAVSSARLKIAGATYTGTDGCADFGGHVSVQPGAIAFTGVPTENPSCTGAPADQADTIDSLLSTGGLWAIRDGNLVIWDAASGQAFSLVFASGSTSPPTVTNPADKVIGLNWYLTGVQHTSGSTVSDTPVDFPIRFAIRADGGFVLEAPCERGTGTAQVGDRTIDFAGFEQVPHSCLVGAGYLDDDSAAAENVVFGGSASWQVDNDQLTLTAGDYALTFGPQAPTAESNPLYGHKWLLDSRNADNSGSYYDWASGAKIPYMQFYGTGRFFGRDACVRLNGTVAVRGGTLSFGSVHRDATGCKNSDTPYFRDILTTDVTWSVSHGELRLRAHGLTLGFLGP